MRIQSLLLILLAALCWGPSYLFIKIAVSDIPPITLVFLRCAIAALILHCVCYLQRQPKVDWKRDWKQVAVLGIT